MYPCLSPQPSSWAELPLLNPLTGNFCMPRCEEPWYEFKFEDPKEGTVQVGGSPTEARGW
jgi:hypothetical protein